MRAFDEKRVFKYTWMNIEVFHSWNIPIQYQPVRSNIEGINVYDEGWIYYYVMILLKQTERVGKWSFNWLKLLWILLLGVRNRFRLNKEHYVEYYFSGFETFFESLSNIASIITFWDSRPSLNHWTLLRILLSGVRNLPGITEHSLEEKINDVKTFNDSDFNIFQNIHRMSQQ